MTNEIIAEPRLRSKPRSNRRPIAPKLRFAVLERDGFTCQYCGAAAPDVVLHCDHIEPVSKGGKNHLDNLITACVDCNIGKGANRLDDEAARAIHDSLRNGYGKISIHLLKKLQVIQNILVERVGGNDDDNHMSELIQLHNLGIDLFSMEYFARISTSANGFWDMTVDAEFGNGQNLMRGLQ